MKIDIVNTIQQLHTCRMIVIGLNQYTILKIIASENMPHLIVYEILVKVAEMAGLGRGAKEGFHRSGGVAV